MALIYNGTSIPQTGKVIHNSASLTKVVHNTTVVWEQVLDVNVLATGSYTISGKNTASYINTSGMYAVGNASNARYNHAICIRVATGDHAHLYLAGTMQRAWYAMSRVRVGASDPQLYNNLYGGEGEGPGDEYLEYHSGWVENQRWVSNVSFSRTISVPKNSNIYISLQGTNTTDSDDWGTANPWLNQIILKP